jgi:DEAD/DEAH box helicase domain-containing protein
MLAGIRATRCTEGNDLCAKVGALLILKSLLDIDTDPDTVPNLGVSNLPNTIIEAESVRRANDVQVEFEE